MVLSEGSGKGNRDVDSNASRRITLIDRLLAVCQSVGSRVEAKTVRYLLEPAFGLDTV